MFFELKFGFQLNFVMGDPFDLELGCFFLNFWKNSFSLHVYFAGWQDDIKEYYIGII